MKNMTISTENEAMQMFEDLRRQACGEAIGSDTQSPYEAAEAEGWEVLREWHERRVLAQDGAGNLWVVCDIYGPWAIRIQEA